MSEETVLNDKENKSDVSTIEKGDRLCRLPLSRVKHLVKLDPEVGITSQEAVFVIAKATELFIDCLTKESHSYTLQAKKKTLQRKDIDLTIDNIDSLVFLEGTLD